MRFSTLPEMMSQPNFEKKKISQGKMISVDIWIIKYWGGGYSVNEALTEKRRSYVDVYENPGRGSRIVKAQYTKTQVKKGTIICGYDINEQMTFYKQSLECWHLVDLMKNVAFWRAKINGGQERINHSTVWNSSYSWRDGND